MALVINWLNKTWHSPSLFQRTRLNLALWYTGVMGAIILAAATGYYLVTVQQQLAEVDRDLASLSKTLIAGIEINDDDEDNRHGPRLQLNHVPFLGEESRTTSFPQGYIHWYHPDGRIQQSVGRPPDLPPRSLQSGLVTLGGAPSYREQTTALAQAGRTLGYLQVGLSLTPLEEELHQVRLTLGVGVPLVLVIVGVAGWVLAGIAIVPIEQSYARLQKFTADASHELRTPLATLRANAQAALKQPAFLETETRTKLEAIDRSSERMSALVADLLFLARADSTQTAREREVCNLAEVLADLCEELAPLAVRKEVRLSFQGQLTQVLILANLNDMYRLFANLITNAVKYVPAGGKVRVDLGVAAHQAIVTVEDTGIGIPVEHQPYIFERFYRVDSARGREVGGSGLGLAICRSIARLHSGTVELTRSSSLMSGTVEPGSVFTVRLPLHSSEPPPVQELVPKEHEHHHASSKSANGIETT